MTSDNVPAFRFSKGRIAVYNGEHDLIDSRIYYTAEGLRKIMTAWFNDYPDGYYIQVRPYEKSQTSEKIRLDIIKKEEKANRPPPIYSNIPIYDYFNRKNGHGK